MDRALVTGGAGFIGSHVVDQLRDRGVDVVVIDDLSGGRRDFLAHHDDVPLIEASVQDEDALREAIDAVDVVFHLAADPVVKGREAWPDPDLEATMTLMEVMDDVGVDRLAYTSSSTVYGEAEQMPTPEDYGPLLPISFYGASKLAQEAYVFAADHSYDFDTWVYRFANIIGPRQTHGVIVDFLAKLADDPSTLEVLGDGRQEKSYLDVRDCAEAILLGVDEAPGDQEALNIGNHDTVSVLEIADIVKDEAGCPDAEVHTTGGKRGWTGDVPRMQLGIDELVDLGFEPRYGSAEAVRQTARWLVEQGHGP